MRDSERVVLVVLVVVAVIVGLAILGSAVVQRVEHIGSAVETVAGGLP